MPTPGKPRPSDPGGQPSSRVMMIAPSVEPKPSHTMQSKRRLNAAMSRSLASLPKATRNGLSWSSGRSGVASTYASGLPT
ncbi:Uncharacterised protein [Mycobacterium tuberculosis]|nr:Uncharacterised protein [Mycobacterium tuberculosis]